MADAEILPRRKIRADMRWRQGVIEDVSEAVDDQGAARPVEGLLSKRRHCRNLELTDERACGMSTIRTTD